MSERVKLDCNDTCPFVQANGIRPCGSADHQDICEETKAVIAEKVPASDEILAIGNDIWVYDGPENVATISNGVLIKH